MEAAVYDFHLPLSLLLVVCPVTSSSCRPGFVDYHNRRTCKCGSKVILTSTESRRAQKQLIEVFYLFVSSAPLQWYHSVALTHTADSAVRGSEATVSHPIGGSTAAVSTCFG